jgi:hypothetical protein
MVLVGFAVTGFFTLSCAYVTPLYSGDRRPREQVGLLKMGANGVITDINGRKLEGRAYELLPGEYSVRFRTYFREEQVLPGAEGQRRKLTCEFALAVEAGHEYRITADKPEFLAGIPQRAGEPKGYFEFRLFVVDLGPDGKPIRSKRADCTWH